MKKKIETYLKKRRTHTCVRNEYHLFLKNEDIYNM